MFSNSAQVSSKLKIITRHKKKNFRQHHRKGPYKTYKSLPLYELGTDLKKNFRKFHKAKNYEINF